MGLESLLKSKVLKNVFLLIIIIVALEVAILILIYFFPFFPGIGSIQIQETDLFCNVDSDCTSTLTWCGNCGCGNPVNVESRNKYLDIYRKTCENYPGEIFGTCASDCPAQRPACIENNCELIYADRCYGLNAQSCEVRTDCDSIFGPSQCSNDGTVCTKDIAFQKCVVKQN